MISTGKCICGAKGRFICPSLETSICSQCCGLKRNSKIICKAECPNNPFGFQGYDKGLQLNSLLVTKILLYLRDELGVSHIKNLINSALEGIDTEDINSSAEEGTRTCLLLQKMMQMIKETKMEEVAANFSFLKSIPSPMRHRMPF